MRSPTFWGIIYLLMGSSFIFFAIEQKARSGGWDIITIALVAIATYDYMVAVRYFMFKKTIKKKD